MNTSYNYHIVKSYDDELNRLVTEIIRMGEIAVAQLEAALDVVERRDDKAADRIVMNDEAIDALEQSISHDVMRLALRGPMARDLREILAGLRIPADIERIGDYAANVAKRSIALNTMPPLPRLPAYALLASFLRKRYGTHCCPTAIKMSKSQQRYARMTPVWTLNTRHCSESYSPT